MNKNKIPVQNISFSFCVTSAFDHKMRLLQSFFAAMNSEYLLFTCQAF